MIEVVERSAASTMVQAANEQLTELQAAIESLDQRISEAQVELAAIADAREDCAHRLSTARAETERLSGENDQAVAYAKLAHKTPNQSRAVKAASDAKKAMQTAQGKLSKLEAETTEADQVADARELELGKQVQLWHLERAAREDEVQAVMRGRAQALKELGEEQYAKLLQGYQAKQKQVDQVAAHLVDLQVGLHDLYESSIQDLKDWPDLQREFAGLRPVDDPTSGVIEATLAYMDMLLREGTDVRMGLPMPWDMRDCLFVREGEAFTPGQLAERRRKLQQVLDAYRQLTANENPERR